MPTCGGANSGKTSYLACVSEMRAVAEQQECQRHDDAAKAHGEADDGGLQAAVASGGDIRRRHQSSPPTWICERNSSESSSCARRGDDLAHRLRE